MTTSIEDRIKAAQAPDFDPEKVEFDVWGTQGGGLATWDSNAKDGEGTYVWIQLPPWYATYDGPEKEEFEGLGEMPSEWGVIPANEAAHRQMRNDWVMDTIDSSWADF